MVIVISATLVFLAMYGALMVWLYIGIDDTKSFQEYSNDLPAVSVVVSLRNEANNIQLLLEGLLTLDYPKDKLEIILVNDNSTDNTLKLLSPFESRKVIVVNNTGNGKKQAIDLAVNRASGEWILVTDADCILPNSWVKSMVSRITSRTKMVLGPVFIKEAHTFFEQLQSVEFFGLQGTTCGSAGMTFPISANAANMLFRKEVFEKLNPYENNYKLKTGDDQFLLMAITNRYPQSVTYSLEKGSIVLTHPVKTWGKYFSQRIRWASKGSAYTQLFPKLVGMLVFAISLVVIVDWSIGFRVADLKLVFLPLLAKMILDLFVILPMKRFSGVKINSIYYPLFTLVYAFVVVFTVVAGLFKK